MKEIEIAELKDNILNYLLKSPRQHISSVVIYNELNLKNIPMSVFSEYLKEMEREGVINLTEMSGNRITLFLQDAGKRLIFEGGYVNRINEKLIGVKEKKEGAELPNKKRVLFISYASENYDKVKLIKKELANHLLFEPFVVADRRKPNKALVKLVSDGIDSAYCIVPILSPQSYKTQWINQEIGYAAGKDIPIIPIVETTILDNLKGL
jgi:predicted transcriptional regulator